MARGRRARHRDGVDRAGIACMDVDRAGLDSAGDVLDRGTDDVVRGARRIRRIAAEIVVGDRRADGSGGSLAPDTGNSDGAGEGVDRGGVARLDDKRSGGGDFVGIAGLVDITDVGNLRLHPIADPVKGRRASAGKRTSASAREGQSRDLGVEPGGKGRRLGERGINGDRAGRGLDLRAVDRSGNGVLDVVVGQGHAHASRALDRRADVAGEGGN